MPEEQNAAPQNEDTPQQVETATHEDTADETGVVDYRSRYENLLPEFTRKSQRLAELEAQLGDKSEDAQYDDDDDAAWATEDEYLDPDDLRRLARQEAEALLTQRERQQAEEQAEIAYVNSEIETLEKEVGENFSDAEWDFLGRTSEDLRDEHGRPDVRRAYEQFTGILEGRKKQWVGRKRSARPGSGPGAAEVVDLDDRNQREEYIDRILSGDA